MKILFFGDLIGRDGREAVLKSLPALRAQHEPDAVIVNGDNAAGGFGITASICEELFSNGVDVITGGDHVWDQREIAGYIAHEKRLLRPHNFPPKLPGSGVAVVETKAGKLVVVHLLGQVFHKEHLDCPFAAADRALAGQGLGRQAAAILVDFHAETTSEKGAMGYHLDGRVSAVFGTHTHIPTDDARILPGGTAFQTDVGMCGVYDSVIGFEKDAPLQHFTLKTRKLKMAPATGNVTVRGVLIETDAGGLARRIERIRLTV